MTEFSSRFVSRAASVACAAVLVASAGAPAVRTAAMGQSVSVAGSQASGVAGKTAADHGIATLRAPIVADGPIADIKHRYP